MNLDFYRAFSISVDLALEARDIIRGATGREIPGVEERVQQLPNGKVTTITIKDKNAEQVMGKPMGTYVTIEVQRLRFKDPEVQEEISQAVAQALTALMSAHLRPQSHVLIIGLGNWKATPDSLGPKTVEYIPVTRHLHKYAPEALITGMRPVSAVAPGVLGTTGIETVEIIKGIVQNVKCDLVVVIDALAAQSTERIGTSIQISNTGIQPGSGIGNPREPINHETLGIPVIAIGVPTVVSAATIANQAIQRYCQNTGAIFNQEISLNSIRAVLSYFGGSLTVTPKEIDDLIENTARIVSTGISYALFPGIPKESFGFYTS
ncbi:MAG TPA: GPR endopeptidase [Syntrophothermus lipocalidus]|uniref:Germination protease n=1 Tax=Syntrophothermus lipocalidus (strain DSM 12680 / TGB-C1) TaxID=643648 RepID=D7CLT9_SYNLT|nr:GPR endopeptidase [Syntrophothermus lipocalidus]ADI01674.1 spore protease [Syntrophothermus lipocalidus DSM 12680]HHV77071.1 GPR endopeptidase [Syntrophothermus lipocalidus]HOV43485.1 GPR endopeptidase [Syntrophothermus lipocalidus]